MSISRYTKFRSSRRTSKQWIRSHHTVPDNRVNRIPIRTSESGPTTYGQVNQVPRHTVPDNNVHQMDRQCIGEWWISSRNSPIMLRKPKETHDSPSTGLARNSSSMLQHPDSTEMYIRVDLSSSCTALQTAADSLKVEYTAYTYSRRENNVMQMKRYFYRHTHHQPGRYITHPTKNISKTVNTPTGRTWIIPDAFE